MPLFPHVPYYVIVHESFKNKCKRKTKAVPFLKLTMEQMQDFLNFRQHLQPR